MIATRLKVDHLYTPLGLGNTSPGFSWNAEGGAAQTAYRLIARCEGHVLWDTGRVYSARMTNIRYGGLPLCSRQRVDWSVTLWDESGIAGETVESRFEIGLLDASDWSARWISGSYKPNKKKRYPSIASVNPSRLGAAFVPRGCTPRRAACTM